VKIVQCTSSPIFNDLLTTSVQLDAGPIRPRNLVSLLCICNLDLVKLKRLCERLGFRCPQIDLKALVHFSTASRHVRSPHTFLIVRHPVYARRSNISRFHFRWFLTEVMQKRFSVCRKKGYQACWGPGRHIRDRNWFWYFQQPICSHMKWMRIWICMIKIESSCVPNGVQS